jgi:hypothetical protein
MFVLHAGARGPRLEGLGADVVPMTAATLAALESAVYGVPCDKEWLDFLPTVGEFFLHGLGEGVVFPCWP